MRSEPGPSNQGGSSSRRDQVPESEIRQKPFNPPRSYDLDSSSSDIDLLPDMYAIPDPDFDREVMVRSTSLLYPGAIQQL
jgi:hypothetical protein